MRQKQMRGFAAMDENTKRSIARKGGIAAHLKGTAHEFNSVEARQAGRKGGLAVSQDRAHMALIGRHGGQVRGARALAARGHGHGHGHGLGMSQGAMYAQPGS